MHGDGRNTTGAGRGGSRVLRVNSALNFAQKMSSPSTHYLIICSAHRHLRSGRFYVIFTKWPWPVARACAAELVQYGSTAWKECESAGPCCGQLQLHKRKKPGQRNSRNRQNGETILANTLQSVLAKRVTAISSHPKCLPRAILTRSRFPLRAPTISSTLLLGAVIQRLRL